MSSSEQGESSSGILHRHPHSRDGDSDGDDDDEEVLAIATRHRRKNKRSSMTLKRLGLLLMLLTLCCLGGYWGWRVYLDGKTSVFIPNAIVVNIPRRTCLLVDEQTIEENKRNPRWQRVVQSMRYYLDEEGLEGISAFHLGEADCFIMVRMQDNSTLSMYNARFVGFDQRSISVRPEQSLACPSITRTMKRSDVIIASYLDDTTGHPILIRLENEVAWAFQHVNAYSLGKTICDLHAENTDREIEGLRSYLE